MKVFFHYYKALLAFNLPFSLFVGGVASTLEAAPLMLFFTGFFFCFLFLGLGLSWYFFWLRFPEQYYFYHNRGWSKLALLGGVFLVNFAFYLMYVFAKPMLYAS